MHVLLALLCTMFTTFAFAHSPKQLESPKNISMILLKERMQKYPRGNDYKVKKIHARGMLFELEDGSMWQVQPLGPESRSFHEQKNGGIHFHFVEDLVKKWKKGDRVAFFQRQEDLEELMIYNATKDELIDATPFLSPHKSALKLVTLKKKELSLDDGSKWKFNAFSPKYEWEAGDQILIAKPSPWEQSSAPYLLINLCACRCDATVRHIHPNRQPVSLSKD